MNNLYKISENCMMLEIVLSTLIGCTITLNLKAVTSLLFALTFLIYFFMLFINISNKDKNIVSILLISILVFIIVFSNLKLNYGIFNVAFGYEYYNKVFIFISIIVFLFFATNVRINKKYQEICVILPCFLGAFLLFAYYILGTRDSLTTFNYLRMNFLNPNFLGMWLVVLIIYQFISFYEAKKTALKIINIILAVLLIGLLLKTGARGCFLGLVYFIITACYVIYKNKLSNLYVLLSVLFPLIFLLLYSFLLSNSGITGLFEFMSSEAKGLDSRLGVWTDCYNLLHTDLILGNYYIFSGGTGASQGHNIYMDVVCSYGIIVLGIFIYFLVTNVLKINKICFTKTQKLMLVGFLANIIAGCFEAGFVSGSTGLSYLIISFLILANSYEGEKDIMK